MIPARATLLSRLFLLMMLILPVLCAARPAHAAMLFCNRTKLAIEAALGYREKDDWISEGWWRIEPGQCSRVYGQPLDQRFYFYYATALSSPGHERSPYVWAGKYSFCTGARAFRINGDGDCESRDYLTKGFQEIDVGLNNHDYTLDFKETD
jgi:uncharacterized membrane protein